MYHLLYIIERFHLYLRHFKTNNMSAVISHSTTNFQTCVHRGDQKVDYDQRLQQEVEALRARTALEVEQLKTQTREMFERESRYDHRGLEESVCIEL